MDNLQTLRKSLLFSGLDEEYLLQVASISHKKSFVKGETLFAEGEPATGFYRALGGKAVARSSEKFGNRVLDKVAFAWNG